jgi:hypothetical protein
MASAVQIREAMHAQPFRPFTIRLVDGRNDTVRHPDFFSVSTRLRNRDLTVHDDDGVHLIDPALVVEVHPDPTKGKSGKAAAM